MVVSSDGLDVRSSILSPREREVALLIARDLSNKEIARELGLTEGTVKQHIHHIFLKLRSPKFASGIGGLGLLGWRRKRKAPAVG
jgi:DNA-binding CsgD family transcriptional regulator